ncbi:MAG: hypothetical protein P0Y59_04870 [Candidatus Sphingomonas phytovorans]|nr:hypothetical protein [Sphingomonas sp.]WEK01030.1 MAG: hypothetical protein P0Y59_04870 [Sphingomonas sp.]
MFEAFFPLISGKVASFPRNSGAFFRCYAITGKSALKALVSGIKIPLKIQHNSGRKKDRRTAASPVSARSLTRRWAFGAFDVRVAQREAESTTSA